MSTRTAIWSSVALLCIIALPLSGFQRADEPGCNPRVKAILSDGHRLVPGGLAPVRVVVGYELRRLGVSLTWMKEQPESPDVLRVVFLPHSATDWGQGSGTLGAVRLQGNSPSSIYVFYPAVKKVLGEPGDTTSILDPPTGSIWRIGLARIILHEILHFLLPGRPHDASGLFARNLEARELLGPKLELEANTRSALIARLCVPPP